MDLVILQFVFNNSFCLSFELRCYISKDLKEKQSQMSVDGKDLFSLFYYLRRSYFTSAALRFWDLGIR